VCTVSEAACTFNATGLETLGLPRHTQWLLGLRLVLARTHDPVLVLLLLFCQDLNLTRRHASVVSGVAKFESCFVGKCEWGLPA